MRYLKWAGVAAAVVLVVACFMPWVVIGSRQIIVTGIDGSITPDFSFGRPGYINLLMALLFIPLTLIPRVWAKRLNLAIVAINLAWTARNYFVLGTCSGGECPERQTGLFLLVLASLLMLVSALLPDVELKETRPEK